METTETARPLTFEQPTTVEPVVATVPVPTIAQAAVADDSPDDHGLTALMGALRAREPALIDATILKESAVEMIAAVRSSIQDLHLEDVRFDLSVFTSAIGRFGRSAHGLTSIRPARLPAPDASYPTHVRKIRVTPTVSAKFAKPRAPRRLFRVRWGRVVTRGLTVGVLAAVLMSVPPEQLANVANEAGPVIVNVANEVGPVIGKVANEAGSAIANIASQVTAAIGETLAAAQPAPTLARASFELPPLSAYGAAFEAQAAYPVARPNGTVEWVVALRNTGSVGWYRGIDGAQASLALADGTAAGVQTTAYVGPGQVGWFVVHFTAPSQPGVSRVSFLPRIDGRGPLPDLGIYATVTVSPNP
jgi:hypothetical protein